MEFLTVPHEKGAPLGQDLRLGLVVLSTDQTVEVALRDMLPMPTVATYVTRVKMGAETSMDNLRSLEDGLTQALSLLPEQLLDVIAFACTSGTIAITPAALARKMSAGRPGVAATNPISAALDAFDHLGVKRIALLTPYIGEVNHEILDFIVRNGIEVSAAATFNLRTEEEIADVSTDSIVEAACGLDDPTADAVFISCTGLRSHLAIDAIERRIGKPVVTSNQALAWKALQFSKRRIAPSSFGRLLAGS